MRAEILFGAFRFASQDRTRKQKRRDNEQEGPAKILGKHRDSFWRRPSRRSMKLRTECATVADAKMKNFAAAALILFSLTALAEKPSPKFATANPSDDGFDEKAAERFANLALACVGKEYPNKISHLLNSDADVAPPRKLTPAFCGCYDWHSSVHGHWLLVRLVKTFPDAPFAQPARESLRKSLTAENLK